MPRSSELSEQDEPETHAAKDKTAEASKGAANSPAAHPLSDASMTASRDAPAELEHQAERELWAEEARQPVASRLLHS